MSIAAERAYHIQTPSREYPAYGNLDAVLDSACQTIREDVARLNREAAETGYDFAPIVTRLIHQIATETHPIKIAELLTALHNLSYPHEYHPLVEPFFQTVRIRHGELTRFFINQGYFPKDRDYFYDLDFSTPSQMQLDIRTRAVLGLAEDAPVDSEKVVQERYKLLLSKLFHAHQGSSVRFDDPTACQDMLRLLASSPAFEKIVYELVSIYYLNVSANVPLTPFPPELLAVFTTAFREKGEEGILELWHKPEVRHMVYRELLQVQTTGFDRYDGLAGDIESLYNLEQHLHFPYNPSRAHLTVYGSGVIQGAELDHLLRERGVPLTFGTDTYDLWPYEKMLESARVYEQLQQTAAGPVRRQYTPEELKAEILKRYPDFERITHTARSMSSYDAFLPHLGGMVRDMAFESEYRMYGRGLTAFERDLLARGISHEAQVSTNVSIPHFTLRAQMNFFMHAISEPRGSLICGGGYYDSNHVVRGIHLVSTRQIHDPLYRDPYSITHRVVPVRVTFANDWRNTFGGNEEKVFEHGSVMTRTQLEATARKQLPQNGTRRSYPERDGKVDRELGPYLSL